MSHKYASQWFDQIYAYLKPLLTLPLSAVINNWLDFPHICLEYTTMGMAFGNLTGDISFSIATTLDEKTSDMLYVQNLQEILEKPIFLDIGTTSFKEIKITRRSDKKIKYLVLHYQWIVKLQQSAWRSENKG